MTARNLYNAVLIELNKENAPNILLEDFNYFANKAINNYINKRYNIYDISQQTTDDLRVLKSSAILKPTHVNAYEGFTTLGVDRLATYEVILPSDYLHLLNCICVYKVKKTYDCYNRGQSCVFPAKRLTADMYSQVVTNYWNKPTYKNPYYYIHNVNKLSGEEYKIMSDEADVAETFSKYTYENTPTDPFDYSENKETKKVFSKPSHNSVLNFDYEVDFSHADYDVIKIEKEQEAIEDDVTKNYLVLVYSKNTDGCFASAETKIDLSQHQDENEIQQLKENFYDYIKDYDFNSEGCGTVTPLIYNSESLQWEMDEGSALTPVDDVEKAYLEAKIQLYEQQLIPTHGKDIKGVDSSRELNKAYNYKGEQESTAILGKDGNENVIVQGSGLPKSIKIGDDYVSNVERGASLRYGNVSEVRLEIRYGTDNRVFELVSVYVDYIKAPQNIRLTQMEIDQTEDTSQMLEYPDYVCQEIINELIHLIMENISDQRLQTHPVVSQSIANPAQAQTPEAAG